MLHFTLADAPLVLWYIGVLIFLEGVLSADNALVLALMVRHLPRLEQKRVLRYGIWGAVLFRVVAVLLSAVLLKFWIFKVVGGAYLLYLALAHFWKRWRARNDAENADGNGAPGDGAGKNWLQGFWGTVTSITLADIAFSIDSILAAVAMADSFPGRFGNNGKVFIVITGGILGIITMRFVAVYFVTLLDRFPGLAEGAYLLVAWIGLKLVISGFYDAGWLPHHVPEWLFWSGMLSIAVLSFIIQPRGAPAHHAEGLELLENASDDAPSEPPTSANGPVRDEAAVQDTGR